MGSLNDPTTHQRTLIDLLAVLHSISHRLRTHLEFFTPETQRLFGKNLAQSLRDLRYYTKETKDYKVYIAFPIDPGVDMAEYIVKNDKITIHFEDRVILQRVREHVVNLQQVLDSIKVER